METLETKANPIPIHNASDYNGKYCREGSKFWILKVPDKKLFLTIIFWQITFYVIIVSFFNISNFQHN